MRTVHGFTQTAGLALALALTLGCSSSDDSPDQPPSGQDSKNACIQENLALASTLGDVGKACGASESEVLSQMQGDKIGSCNKNNLDFDKSIEDLLQECGASEIATVPLSSSSQGKGVSSSSDACIATEKIEGDILKDDRDGKEYKTVVICSQTWMAENLSYAEGSRCMGTLADCEKYGRFYDWATAMALPESCNTSSCADQIQAKHQGICPSGWHIPSGAEWNELFASAGIYQENGNYRNAEKLMATSGWTWDDGTDDFGFAALPTGGIGSVNLPDGGVSMQGAHGGGATWWYTTSEWDDTRAFRIDLPRAQAYGNYNKINSYSVRCVKD